jgi:glycosyltransferase involved in cell wall biosynthesis
MHILALTRYSSLGSSSRVRFYQYLPYLESKGIVVYTAPLLDDNYLHRLYGRKRADISRIFLAYFHRILWLARARSFDLIWLEKEIFPWLPAWGEHILSRLHIPYVVDYDDAVFHRYDMDDNPLIRALLGKKIDAVMRKATTVVVGNEYLAEHACQTGASRVEILPSVVDTNRYSIREKTGEQFRIGWIGSPITAPYLSLISEALEEVSQKINMRLVLVGAGNLDLLPNMEKEILPWIESTEVTNIQSFDVGIMPLPDAPFERGKCGYKLVQYMACGLPVIASPVGANSSIIDQGKTGFLASSNAEWVQALIMLSQSPHLRRNLGKAGRKKVEQEFSLQVTAPRLFHILTDAASRLKSGHGLPHTPPKKTASHLPAQLSI